MGKKRRYRARAGKFGIKYSSKYIFNIPEEESIQEFILEETAQVPEIIAAPEPAVEKPIIVAEAAPVVKPDEVNVDPIVEAVKKTTTKRKTTTYKRTTSEKAATTPRKTRRKITTSAKTPS